MTNQLTNDAFSNGKDYGLDFFTTWRFFVLRCAFLPTTLFANHSSCIASIMVLPLSSSSFHWQHKVSIYDTAKWLSTGFFWSDMDSLQRSFYRIESVGRHINKYIKRNQQQLVQKCLRVCGLYEGNVIECLLNLTFRKVFTEL